MSDTDRLTAVQADEVWCCVYDVALHELGLDRDQAVFAGDAVLHHLHEVGH